MSDIPRQIWVHPDFEKPHFYTHDFPHTYQYIRADRVQMLVEVLKDIQEIIHNSHGVSGWHLNGDIATWDEFSFDVDEVLAAFHSPKGLSAEAP